MIDFAVCVNCGWPIFHDWKGAHHVSPDGLLAVPGGLSFDPTAPQCNEPSEDCEED